jgi:ribosome assembly protein YihI (activator of Der GTPase)
MAQAFKSEKVMFEIYRDPNLGGRHRVVYFTELDEHNKEKEINDAMRGDHLFDGFIPNHGKEASKQAVNALLARLDAGESLTTADIARELKPFLA